MRYLLTLTCAHTVSPLDLCRRARQTLRESLSRLSHSGLKRIALYVTGEAAELAYLTLEELGFEPVGVFAQEAGGRFLAPIRK